MKYSVSKFKHGFTSVFDEERSSQPIDMVIIENIHNIILADRQIKVREVAVAVAVKILHDKCVKGVGPLCAAIAYGCQYQSSVCTPFREIRKSCCLDTSPLMIVGYIIIHKKPSNSPDDFGGKVIATIFFEFERINPIKLFAEWKKKHAAVLRLLDWFDKILIEKQSHLAKKGGVFYNNNAYSFEIVAAKLHKPRYKLLPIHHTRPCCHSTISICFSR